MGESTKSVCALLMIVGVIGAALAWTADHPDATTWGFRIGAPTVAILALGLLLGLHFRADVEPDYLRAITGTYFNRDGLFLRSNTNFGNSFGTALAVAGAATGSIALSKPAVAKVAMPIGVAEHIRDDLAPEIKTLWQLGDPPIEIVR